MLSGFSVAQSGKRDLSAFDQGLNRVGCDEIESPPLLRLNIRKKRIGFGKLALFNRFLRLGF
jgi:hypothetical protein